MSSFLNLKRKKKRTGPKYRKLKKSVLISEFNFSKNSVLRYSSESVVCKLRIRSWKIVAVKVLRCNIASL